MSIEKILGIERLLVLEAHHDDYILICGATARRLRNAGKEVYVVTFTNGGASGADSEQARLERAEESRKADEILGTTAREILDFETRGCWDNTSKLYNELLARIRRIRPDTIITMHNDGLHPDHIWIATFVEALGYQAAGRTRADWGEPVNARVLLGESPRSQLRRPDFYVDITETFQAKEAALREHKSQLPTLGQRIFDDMRVLAEYRAMGAEMKVKYCEAFEELRGRYKEVV